MDDPLLHLPRAQRLVELQRRLVPVEHGPFQPAAAAIARDARQRPQQRTPDAVTAQGGAHEQILEIQPGPADKRREVEEVQRESGGLTVPLGDEHAYHGIFCFELTPEIRRVRLGLVQQLFVIGQFAHQACDGGRVRGRGGSDVQHGPIYSAIYQRMSSVRSSTKRL
jgi:hypothetical protein